MPATKQLQTLLQLNLKDPWNTTSVLSRRNASNNVDPLDHDYSLVFKSLPDPNSVDNFAFRLNKMKLDNKLDLSAHPVNKLVNLPYVRVQQLCWVLSHGG